MKISLAKLVGGAVWTRQHNVISATVPIGKVVITHEQTGVASEMGDVQYVVQVNGVDIARETEALIRKPESQKIWEIVCR